MHMGSVNIIVFKNDIGLIPIAKLCHIFIRNLYIILICNDVFGIRVEGNMYSRFFGFFIQCKKQC